MLRVAVVRFPGSNCDVDTLRAAERVGARGYFVWHRDTDLQGADVVLIPGGFSYGDYLRAGAIARFSPIMQAVQRHATAGGPVLGICNGFQIMCEAHLLPGALMRNARLTYASRPVNLRIERSDTPFTCAYQAGQVITLPVAHGEGRYVADVKTLAELEATGRVVVRYVAPDGGPASDGDNPTGSINDIAGICNAEGNLVGLMPHPDRMTDPALGLTEGLGFFESRVGTVKSV
jgi:phosphoribosylformylglycinamidine synthase subunit PurQ / glutaminase